VIATIPEDDSLGTAKVAHLKGGRITIDIVESQQYFSELGGEGHFLFLADEVIQDVQ
jgi:hypothetical protein